MDSLSNRLKALGVKPASALPQTAKVEKTCLEEIIQGRVSHNSLGEFVIRQVQYPQGYQHGTCRLTSQVYTAELTRTAKMASSIEMGNMLFIDTETSGLSGGAGTFAFLVGVGYFSDAGFDLQQYIIRDPSEEAAMLLHLIDLIGPEMSFVSFNGKSFDIPLLQNRLVINRLPGNLREFPHLDVLHISRKLWRRKLTSCALKDLEPAIIGFHRTSEDVPGWMIPDIYFEYLKTGNPERLSEVIYHNAQDILSLAALFIHISLMFQQNGLAENIDVDDLIEIAHIYADLGEVDTSINIGLASLKQISTPEQTIKAYGLMGNNYKKKGCLSEAAEYWVYAAQKGDVQSAIELAMYYEHTVKDPDKALEWCHFVLGNNRINGLKDVNRLKFDLEKRCRRLNMKRSKNV